MTDREPFRTRIKVRHYELDTLGHLNHAVYHSYGEVARLELLEAAGALHGMGKVASVLLETNVVFRRELRAGDVVDVTCDVKFGSGKTFKMDSNIIKLDGTLAAEIACTLGLMDLEIRKLVADPRAAFEAAGADLKVLSTSE
ncbi:acyl-CoA thioester hydrolase [Amycolatopsis tolypomycina]|uniref:Acyl-CoA thioester hydrolase n=1 Tax=Amycolatopsis tolypomycina TaxID=208445 RepID=A0A1H4IEK5_9PSEU|nr:acyl-CoA thioesterase [Amycolatopsis tolypomycina]SEB32497.1 acyl-CoA thioester hydrolase [Amycolatopsis tolypomycina]